MACVEAIIESLAVAQCCFDTRGETHHCTPTHNPQSDDTEGKGIDVVVANRLGHVRVVDLVAFGACAVVIVADIKAPLPLK